MKLRKWGVLTAAVLLALGESGPAALAGAQTPTPRGTVVVPRAPRDPLHPLNAPPRTLGPLTPENEAKAERERLDVNPRPGESVEDAARRAGLIPECDYTRGKTVKLSGRDGKLRDVQLPADACLNGFILSFGGTRFVVSVGGDEVIVDPEGRVLAGRESPQEEARVRAKVGWLEAALR